MPRPQRFYLPEPLLPGTRLQLPAGRARQATSVLRLRTRDHIVLFNGDGLDVPATVVAALRGSLTVELGEPYPSLMPPAPVISLALAAIKADRFDWAVQKATELGVAEIVPMETARTVVALRAGCAPGAEHSAPRLERWRRIAIEAAEQCGRGDVPLVRPPCVLAEILAERPALPILLAEDEPRRGLVEVLRSPLEPVLLIVGPEGGFSPEERRLASEAGAASASLGPLVLRSETAAIAAVAFVRALASAGNNRDTERA